jgi:hypothetical protein
MEECVVYRITLLQLSRILVSSVSKHKIPFAALSVRTSASDLEPPPLRVTYAHSQIVLVIAEFSANP